MTLVSPWINKLKIWLRMPKSTLTQESQGGDNNLGVALASYEPHVQCIDGSIGPPGSTVPPLKSCDAIVGLMFASRGVISFGKQGSGASRIVPGTDTCKRLCNCSISGSMLKLGHGSSR